MPWETLAELKASETYQKSETLRKMPEFRLRRFMGVFNAIYAKKIEAGSSKEEAESAAFAMAYASASRFQPTPSGSRPEEKRHYASTMAPLQFSEGGVVQDQSFEMVQKNLATISAAVAGSAFNLDHEGTEPLGIIHRLLPVGEVPDAEARAALPEDAPFVTEFSYFEGTPDDLKKVDTVSAEWLRAKRADGRHEVILPFSFAVTDDPASDKSFGIGIYANVLDAETRSKLDSDQFACPEDRTFPIDTAERVRSALSRIQQPHESKCGKEAMMERILRAAKEFGIEVAGHPAKAAAHSAKGYEGKPGSTSPGASRMADSDEAPTLEVQVAALSKTLSEEKKAREAAEAKAGAYKETVDSLNRKVEAMAAAALDKEATEAVNRLVDEGVIVADKAGAFVDRYKKMGAEDFTAFVADLPRAHIGVASAKAASAPALSAGTSAAIERMSKGIDKNLANGRAF